MTILDIVPVTQPMRLTIWHLAEWRKKSNIDLRSRETHHFYDPLEVERDGLTGELAFAQWLGIYPQNIFGMRPDNGLDFEVNGWRIDIKATRYQEGGLSALEHKRSGSIDIYVLAITLPNCVRLAGWAWSMELLRPETVTNLGKMPSHYLPQSALRSMANLRGVLQDKKL